MTAITSTENHQSNQETHQFEAPGRRQGKLLQTSSPVRLTVKKGRDEKSNF